MAMTCELGLAVQRRHVGDLPAFGSFRLPLVVPRRLSEAYQSVKLYVCGSRSDISDYHADFHEEHDTARHGRGAAWARLGMCELALKCTGIVTE
jgi:hypothetical protein